MNIKINIEAGAAKLDVATPVKAGGGEPVTVVFSEAVPAVSVLELALSPNSSEPEVLAYLDVFAQENATTYTGVLDTNDARLIAHLAGKQSQVLSAEVVVTWPGQARRVFPNFTVTVQPPVITGPTSSEGGPVWVSETTGDARYVRPGVAEETLTLKAPDGSEWEISITNDGQIERTKL